MLNHALQEGGILCTHCCVCPLWSSNPRHRLHSFSRWIIFGMPHKYKVSRARILTVVMFSSIYWHILARAAWLVLLLIFARI